MVSNYRKITTHWLSDRSVDQAVVFASTQEDTDMLAEELAEAGHSVVALHEVQYLKPFVTVVYAAS